ncbi:hypothetical protein HZP37_18175 [Elizabethkingia anophelis]|nr:hypothetical protein [Elizabethkingia anophelis]
MKRLEEIKNEYAQSQGHADWETLRYRVNDFKLSICYEEVAKRYAREVAQASLEKAAENAELGVVKCEDCKCKSNFCTDNIGILKESITNPDNITLL